MDAWVVACSMRVGRPARVRVAGPGRGSAATAASALPYRFAATAGLELSAGRALPDRSAKRLPSGSDPAVPRNAVQARQAVALGIRRAQDDRAPRAARRLT